MAFEWFLALLPLLVVIAFIVILFYAMAKATGLDKLMAIWAKKQKPLEPKQIDYDAALMRDLKRSAKRNRGPARQLWLYDPGDREHSPVYWGKVRGLIPETDVVYLLTRRRLRIFTELAFVPADELSDLHSKELYAHCVGLVQVNKWYWVPVWGTMKSREDRERLNAIVEDHLNAVWHRFQWYITRESGTTQMVAAMESVPGRHVADREPQMVPVPENKGRELEE